MTALVLELKNPICPAVHRVSMKNPFITLGIHFPSMASICQYVAFASKDMEIFNSWFSSFLYLIQGCGGPSPQSNYVVFMTSCVRLQPNNDKANVLHGA